MKNVVVGLEKLGKKYKFETIVEDDKAILLAKNTSGEDVDWIIYNIKEDTVSHLGDSDNCNLWFYDTRKDFTSDILVEFVQDLNELFELKDMERFIVRNLIDPEDWQEITGIHDAYEDERFFNYL